MENNSTFYFNLSTVDNIGVGFFKYSLSSQRPLIIFNNFLSEMLGFDNDDELKEKGFLSFFALEKDRENFVSLINENTRVHFFETRFVKKDGTCFWVAITASLIRNNDDDPYVEGIVEDITAHREMEDKLAMERDSLQSLLDNIPDAVYFKDRACRITKVNNFYARGVGLKPEEIIGKTDFDFYPYNQAKEMFDDDNRVLNTGEPIINKIEKILLADGSWNQALTTKIPMYDRKALIIGTMGITRDMTSYAHSEKEKLQMVMRALDVVSRALEMRDPYTSGHAQRVAFLAETIARELGWDEDRLLALRLAGELHDIGKIGIPQDLLTKPGRLTRIEYQLVQEHVEKCHHLLKNIQFRFPLDEIVYQHHERLDGSGYPRGLKGEEILPEARILAISDVMEAMTYHRPYREALGVEKALAEIKAGAGTRYDKELTDVVLAIMERHGNSPFWLNS